MDESFSRISPGEAQDWASLLGRKVSVRYRPDEEGVAAAEAIGVVMSVGEGEDGDKRVEIVNRRGDVRSVPIRSVMAGKVWPLGDS